MSLPRKVRRVIPEAVTENGKGYLLVNNDPILWSLVNVGCPIQAFFWLEWDGDAGLGQGGATPADVPPKGHAGAN